MSRITVRATVNLSGLRAGETVEVDPTDPRVAGLLRTGLLVDESPPEVAPPQPKRPRSSTPAEVPAPGAWSPTGGLDSPPDPEP